MEISKGNEPHKDLRPMSEAEMDALYREYGFSEEAIAESKKDLASRYPDAFNQLFADLGLPSGTLWARDNADASPFFFNFGEEVDYLHLSIPDECCGDKVLHLQAPTADQIAELIKYTRHEFRDKGYILWKLTSEINGEEILLPVGVEYDDCEGKRVRRIIATHYWTSTEDENDGHRALALAVGNPDGLDIVSLDINTKAFVRSVIKK